MIQRRATVLPWDDLDAALCGEGGAPDWSTLTVAGPVRRTDRSGHATVQWTVTVECRPRPPES